MSWKPYPAYKDSGVEWLRDIPAHWNSKRLRFNIQINPSKTEVSSLPEDLAVSFVPMESVGKLGSLEVDQTKSLEDVSTGYTYFRDGDIVVAKITPCFENGKGAIAEGLENGIGFGTTELHVLRPQEAINCSFLFYVTLSHPFREQGVAFMYGSAGQKRVPDDFIRNFRQPLLPLPEQHHIAAFLDQKTQAIDKLITLKERQLELLKEKRAALISQAVTKGLDPTVPMKDSGVEWLGEIPEGWVISKFKHLVKVKDGTHETPRYVVPSSLSYPLVTSKDLTTGEVNFSEAKYISKDDHLEANRRSDVTKGDIVMPMVGTVGNPVIVDTNDPFSIKNVALFKTSISEANTRYVFYFLSSDFVNTQFKTRSRAGVQGFVSQEIMKNIYAFKISKDEQRQIATFLDRETVRLDTLTSKVKNSIDTLKEYRSALISAAVTGKIDVREEVIT